MTADLARITYDPTRQYRSLLSQQGRVTLEADSNEATALAAEALRLETIDIIGPTGAPGGGYLVGSGNGPGGATIAPGVFYLGGWRLQLDAAIDLTAQPDWLEDAVVAARLPNNRVEQALIARSEPSVQDAMGTARRADALTYVGNLLIALLLTEQSVCAVEDQALREVALGGPDSAARTRLMQHFLKLPLAGADCSSGAGLLASTLQEDGVSIDPASLQLVSTATLQAGFVPGPTNTDPCTPTAAGGYLGADNQLVRVTVTAYDAGTNSGSLLWGWNNAAILYRAGFTDIDANTGQTVMTLTGMPVDEEHAPQFGQAVEILRSSARLDDNNNYVAVAAGFVSTLTQAYSFDNGTLMLADTLPPEYQADPNPLFVRLWQAVVPFTGGAQTALDAVSGIVVTLNMTALPSQIAARPFWHFSVRPFMPQNIYPQRYADAAQPPDGPRQWLTSLGVVQALAEGSTLLADCRVPFNPLTLQHDCTCCSLALDPAGPWFTTLNAALGDPNVTALDVCFAPGTYVAPATITASGVHSVKMRGAGTGTQIIGPTLEAVLEFDNCSAVTLSDLCVAGGLTGFAAASATDGLRGAVTIRGCADVEIEHVVLACADGDRRSASCLAIYNPAFASNPPQQYNARVLNSRFLPGHCQVGILLVNADRAQVEGNVVLTIPAARDITIDELPNRPWVGALLKKQLVRGMTVTQTATTPRQQARLRERNARRKAAPKAQASAGKTAATPKAQAATAKRAATKSAAVATPLLPLLPGLAHVNASVGTWRLQFQSSNKLGSAWNEALANRLSDNSKISAVQKAVNGFAKAVVTTPRKVSPAFINWLVTTLNGMVSTASQGIVIGGTIANDIRILDNTIDGAAQGIHVGLSQGNSGQFTATRVQVRGNTVNIRLTAETAGERHGIYVSRVVSTLISDNQLQLSRVGTSLPTAGIQLAGHFGPSLLLERNCMIGFDYGVFVETLASSFTVNGQLAAPLWKISDNASDSSYLLNPNQFRMVDNIPANPA